MGRRHRFLARHRGVRFSKRLTAFYERQEHTRYQHRYLETEYAPYPLYVDFDDIADLENPAFTKSKIRGQVLEFASLRADLTDAPAHDSCYAHLAIDPEGGRVYLLEPSGDPELIASDLDAFLARLKKPLPR